MEILTTVETMQQRCAGVRHAGKRLGFVPTMGALHAGHISLVHAAKAQCDAVAVSIFVNPTQFGPTEDFSKYPRTLERDLEMLRSEGVDIAFTPSTEEMYPSGATTFVDVEGISDRLDGRSRPGHFRGVATVVSELFHIVQPSAAFFGQKDAAQCAVIRQMVRDLMLPVEIVVCPIIREPDGLAMSSRNAYLSPEERKQALVLSRALKNIQRAVEKGEADPEKLKALAAAIFREEPKVTVDYIELVHPNTLLPAATVAHGTLVAVAAKVGSTRLIDNIVL
jgi:pantoate--beta-alanine ligase